MGVEDGIRGISLREDDLVLAILHNRPSLAHSSEKGVGVEGLGSLLSHEALLRVRFS
jgi:hypothetical protein